MRSDGKAALAAVSALAVLLTAACETAQTEAPPSGQLSPTGDQNVALENPPTAPQADPNAANLDLLITKSMLYAAGLEFHVNPYLVMGLAWHESGWQAGVVSSAGAVGIMQVEPATAAVDGPLLLHRAVNLLDPSDNIEMGTAILKHNLDAYGNDLAKALTAYYAGGSQVTDWSSLRDDCRRYVWAVYNDAMMFKEGRGPV